MPTIVATPGGIDANSYVTLAEANDFLGAELGVAAWAAADQDTRERALITATRQLDRLANRFIGFIASESQALAWPRSVPAIDERSIDASTIPPRVRRACIRLAAALLDDPAALDALSAQPVVREKVGPIEVEYQGTGATRVGWARFPGVLAELGPLLDGGMGLQVVRA